MYENEKKAVLAAARKLREYNLISLTGGNVSLRVGEDRFLVTPSGMDYNEMNYDDVCLIDSKVNLIEGKRKPSSDSEALIYIFENMKEVNAIVHTHQPYATAVGLVCDKLPATLVTIIDANHDDVPVAPWTPSSNLGMGKVCVEYANDSLAVIMKHHGVIAFGKDMQEALYSAVYLEEGAKTYCIAKMMGNVEELPKEEIEKEKAGWQTYGQ